MFDLANIRRLLDAFERSDWEEIHLVSGDSEVRIACEVPASGHPPPAPSAAAGASGAGASGRASPERGGVGDPGEAAGVASPGPAPPAPSGPGGTDVESLHAVVSPSPGIFWRSPAPGEPPFVEVGQEVSAETPVGIVEVMKLMNRVLAGVRGTVRAVLVENAGSVELGQPLVMIDPET